MKDNMKNMLDLMDDVLQEVISSRQDVVVTEPEPESKPEPVEEVTIDQLTKDWEEAQPKAEEKSRLWDTKVKPLEKKEEVYSYFKRRIITGPYLDVVLEHVFGIPREMTYEIEDDLTKEGFSTGHVGNKDRLIGEVELWKRVIATCERDKIEGDFYEDAYTILKRRMSSLNLMNVEEEKRELLNGEESVRKSCGRRKKI